MLVDTHCHLTDPAFAPDRDAVIERMRAAGVGRALVIESRTDLLPVTLPWAAADPTLAVVTGCHPHDAGRWTDDISAILEAAWRDPIVRAVGEIGLDYHYDHAPRDAQRRIFAHQLARAVALDRPVVIHAREADADVVAVLREQPAARVVLHSFSSGPVLRQAGLEDGWFFSFSGMVTFKSWNDDETVRAVPTDRLLLETDAPYLAPVPRRGQRNEPAFVTHTAARVAELRGVSVEAISASSTANAAALFWPGTA
ncbi:MAG TPA: TatD family hydrolase [Gemmatimonadales bacterium]